MHRADRNYARSATAFGKERHESRLSSWLLFERIFPQRMQIALLDP